MIIPKFTERTIPVLEIERHINEETSEEGNQFKRILQTITEFEKLPTVEEMTAILEYESKALDYCYILAINTLDKRGFEKDATDIYNAVNDEAFYKYALKNDLIFAKYCTLQKILEEIFLIRSIKQGARELTFRYNKFDRELLQALQDITNGWKFNIVYFIHI